MRCYIGPMSIFTRVLRLRKGGGEAYVGVATGTNVSKYIK